MAVVVICVLVLLLGLAAVLWWGGLAFRAPSGGDPAGHPSVGLVVRSYVWYVTVALVSGLGAGILAAGAGGRLVMRLLAVTAGPDAQGRITEANEVVGRITADGTPWVRRLQRPPHRAPLGGPLPAAAPMASGRPPGRPHPGRPAAPSRREPH